MAEMPHVHGWHEQIDPDDEDTRVITIKIPWPKAVRGPEPYGPIEYTGELAALRTQRFAITVAGGMGLIPHKAVNRMIGQIHRREDAIIKGQSS